MGEHMSKITKALQIEIPAMEVRKRIYTLRDTQVMLDSDLAEIYGVELRVLKQSVKRNLERFPEDFMWAVTEREFEKLRSQFVIENSENISDADTGPQFRSQIVFEDPQDRADLSLSSKLGSQFVIEKTENHSGPDTKPQIRSQIVFENSKGGSIGRRGNRYAPFVFTEPGVATLASVLHSPQAIQISIGIVRLFIELRSEQRSHPDVISRLESMETVLKQRLDQIEARFQLPAPAIPAPAKNDSVLAIQGAVARHFGLTGADLKSASRMHPISLARQIAIFFMKKHLGMGYSEIGRHLGGRDHSTILHAYRKIHVDSEDNDTVRKSVMTLLNEIQPMLV
jgi:hypothetical protein